VIVNFDPKEVGPKSIVHSLRGRGLGAEMVGLL